MELLREASREMALEQEEIAAGEFDPFHFDGPFVDWTREYLPHYFSKDLSLFHEWLGGLLGTYHARRGRRESVKAPRGAAKTVWSTTAYPLYAGLEGLEKFIMIGAEGSDLAVTYLDAIRHEIDTNERIRTDYADVIARTTHKQGHIVFGTGCAIECCSTLGPILGRKHGPDRPSLFILDDLQKRRHIHSPLQRQRAMEWLTKDCIKAGNAESNVIVLGTALHREAVVCQLDTQPGWNADPAFGNRTWKSIIAWPERMDLWREWADVWRDWDNPNREASAREFFEQRQAEMESGAQVLWAADADLYRLMTIRLTEGEAAFESEFQNNPYDPSLSAWPPEYFDWPGLFFRDLPGDITGRVVSLDPSLGKDAHDGDRWAIATMAQNTAGVLFLDIKADRGGGVDKMLTEVCLAVRDARPDALVIETLCFQELLKEPLQRIAKSLDVYLPRIIQDEDVTNKNIRIHRMGPSLSQRRMRLRKNSPGIAIWLEEARDFSLGAHDDTIDAAEKAHRFFVKPGTRLRDP